MSIVQPHLTSDEIDLPHWREVAACRDEPAATAFFPGGDRGQTLAMTIEAKRVCRTCPVQIECLLYAIETQQEYGVWGGVTEPERRKLRRRLRSARTPSAMIDVLRAATAYG